MLIKPFSRFRKKQIHRMDSFLSQKKITGQKRSFEWDLLQEHIKIHSFSGTLTVGQDTFGSEWPSTYCSRSGICFLRCLSTSFR